MRVKGEKLRALLVAQSESVPSVTLVAPDGRERRISARAAAAEIAGRAFTGYGSSNGIVARIVADDAPRREPFAIFTAVRAAVPRPPHAQKNPHGPLKWAPQLRFAHAGLMGKVSTVHLSGGKVNFGTTTDVDL
jgi:hypothetical protein